jgi:hypothetical protein
VTRDSELTLANYDAQLQALHGKTADSLLGHEIESPQKRTKQQWIEFVPKSKTPLRRRLWRVIQRRLPW